MTRSYVEFPTVVMTATLDQLQPSGLLQARYADGSPEKRAENMMNMASIRVDVAVATGGGDADLQLWWHLAHLMEAGMHFCDIGDNEERILGAKFLDYDAFGLEAEDMEESDEDGEDEAQEKPMLAAPGAQLAEMRKARDSLIAYLQGRREAAEERSTEEEIYQIDQKLAFYSVL